MSQFTRWAQSERSPVARIAALALAGVLFLGVLPYVIIVMCPTLDHWLRLGGLVPGLASLVIGGVLAAVGMTFALWSIYVQVTRGRGTPLPMLPTHELLTSGPFRYCRNPMTLGTILAYLGMSIAAATVTGAAFVLIFGGLLVLYLKRVEEKELTERFAEDYVNYVREVPFIIPKMSRGR
jgi:protein-S-isoprenylcysteine O-methyltransferase Ste14